MNAFHQFIDFDKIKCDGIRRVTKKDMDYAKKLGYRIKLIAQAKKLENSIGIDVSPTLVSLKDFSFAGTTTGIPPPTAAS